VAAAGFEGVIFDFDGLMLDTESCMLASWQYEWRQHGLELDLEDFWAPHGGDLTDVRYDALARAVGPAFDRTASHERRTAFRDELLGRLSLRPGIADWLAEAGELGLRLAIASSSPTEWVRRWLSGLDTVDAFDCFACGDEVGAPKPDPSVYSLALSRLGVPAAHAIAIEDSPHGGAAARTAGLRCVAIPSAHFADADWSAADLVLSSAVELPLADVLRRLAAGQRFSDKA
jgi:putative hydrolase of the HAD superfamily